MVSSIKRWMPLFSFFMALLIAVTALFFGLTRSPAQEFDPPPLAAENAAAENAAAENAESFQLDESPTTTDLSLGDVLPATPAGQPATARPIQNGNYAVPANAVPANAVPANAVPTNPYATIPNTANPNTNQPAVPTYDPYSPVQPTGTQPGQTGQILTPAPPLYAPSGSATYSTPYGAPNVATWQATPVPVPNPYDSCVACQVAGSQPTGDAWERKVGPCSSTLFGVGGNLLKGELVGPEFRISFTAEYSTTQDSVMYGVLQSVSIQYGTSETRNDLEELLEVEALANKMIDQPFSARVRADGNRLIVKDVKFAGLDLNSDDETAILMRTVVVGTYTQRASLPPVSPAQFRPTLSYGSPLPQAQQPNYGPPVPQPRY